LTLPASKQEINSGWLPNVMPADTADDAADRQLCLTTGRHGNSGDAIS